MKDSMVISDMLYFVAFQFEFYSIFFIAITAVFYNSCPTSPFRFLWKL